VAARAVTHRWEVHFCGARQPSGVYLLTFPVNDRWFVGCHANVETARKQRRNGRSKWPNGDD
jgi:hypothetical protein